MKKEKKSKYQKLIDLLNEYEDPFVSWYEEYVEEFGIFVLNNGEQGTAEEIIISKNYGFIKWLVENDKIDGDNARLRKSLWETDTSDIDKIIYTIKNSDYHYVMREAPYEAEETLLMLLSIQDEPIEFLVSILK